METVPVEAPPARQRVAVLVGLLAALSVLVVGGMLADGEVGQAAVAGATILPFMWLAGLVQLGARSGTARVAAWAWLWLLLVGIAAFGLLAVLSALSPHARHPAEAPGADRQRRAAGQRRRTASRPPSITSAASP